MGIVQLLWALSLTGCVEPEGEKTLRFWALGREGEAVTGLIREFEVRHPEVRVDVQQIPWSAGHEKLLTAFAGDDLPDLFQIGNTWIPEFAALGALDPVPQDARIGGYFEASVRADTIEGSVYAVPWYVDTRVLFYRKDLLTEAGWREPPKDWRAWLSALSAVRGRSGGQRFGMLAPPDDWTLLVILALQAGNSILKDEARLSNLDSPDFRGAFQRYLSLFRDGVAPIADATRISNVYQEFARGSFSAFLGGPWALGELRKRWPSQQETQWATSALPSDDGKSVGLSIAGGASLAVSRLSKVKFEARQLIEFLNEPEHQLAFYRATGDLPSRRSTWLSPVLRDEPELRAFEQQLNRQGEVPRIPEWERIAGTLAEYAEQTIRGEISESDAVRAMDRQVNVILEKRRWMLKSSLLPANSHL